MSNVYRKWVVIHIKGQKLRWNHKIFVPYFRNTDYNNYIDILSALHNPRSSWQCFSDTIGFKYIIIFRFFHPLVIYELVRCSRILVINKKYSFFLIYYCFGISYYNILSKKYDIQLCLSFASKRLMLYETQ